MQCSEADTSLSHIPSTNCNWVGNCRLAHRDSNTSKSIDYYIIIGRRNSISKPLRWCVNTKCWKYYFNMNINIPVVSKVPKVVTSTPSPLDRTCKGERSQQTEDDREEGYSWNHDYGGVDLLQAQQTRERTNKEKTEILFRVKTKTIRICILDFQAITISEAQTCLWHI